MSLRNDVENHGKRNIVISVLIDLKGKIKEDTDFVMKAKTHILNVLRKQSLFD